MKKSLSTLVILFFSIEVIAQLFTSVPYEYKYTLKDFPKSNEKVSFSLSKPFSDFKDSVLDKKTTYQHLISLPKVNDSLLSECIKYAMFSLSFEQKYKDIAVGTEIWYGLTYNNSDVLPTFSGIYFKNFSDSTKIYVLTTFSLTYFEKKRKTNTSKYICETIKYILEKNQKKK